MLHNRTFKILILILLAVLCTGQAQAYAVTGNGVNQTEENFSSASAPMLADGGLTCNGAAAGVTCTDYGSYLDYSININVTGLNGGWTGATVPDVYIGSYIRSTWGGEMGMASDFVHSEASVDSWNRVESWVDIEPYGVSRVMYRGFASDPGFYTEVTNRVIDWRYIDGGSGDLRVKGNVDGRLNGYSIIGHIYLYSIPALELTGIEVTQVIQDLNNSVRLIAYKPTCVRENAVNEYHLFSENLAHGDTLFKSSLSSIKSHS